MFNHQDISVFVETVFLLKRRSLLSCKELICPFRCWPCDPAAGSAQDPAELGSPESCLSPLSDLSVPSNPARSAQSLSSYNPFEDEDDTGSTVSEKEDIKAKKLVNKHFPPVSTSPALCLSTLSVQALAPLALRAMHEACRRWPGCQLVGQSLASRFLRAGWHPLTICGCFFSVLR